MLDLFTTERIVYLQNNQSVQICDGTKKQKTNQIEDCEGLVITRLDKMIFKSRYNRLYFHF